MVPKNALQLDVDFVYRKDKLGNWVPYNLTEASVPELKFRYGLFKNIELRAGTRVGYTSVIIYFADHSGLTDPHKYHELFSDYFTIGVKANLLKYNLNKGLISVLAESYLPVFRHEKIIGGHFLPTVTFLSTNQVNNRFSYNLNAGIILNPYESDKQLKAINIGMFPVLSVGKLLKSFVGINYMFFPDYFSTNNLLFHGGILFTPAPSLQVRAATSLEKYVNLKGRSNNVNLGFAWRIKN